MTLTELRERAERAASPRTGPKNEIAEANRYEDFLDAFSPAVCAALCRVVEAGEALFTEYYQRIGVETDAIENYGAASYALDALLREVDGG